MKITLIENGLDSLRKGYDHLSIYMQLKVDNSEEPVRFSALKDSVLSVQHGIEILFKYCLAKEHELLLYSDISPKLKSAFKRRRNGEIEELYEADGVHTVTFKESIERLRDVCGLPIDKTFQDRLLQVEGWRNRITHSGVLLQEATVSKGLIDLRENLDSFLGAAIGPQYLEGQGKTELDVAYRTTIAVYGKLENKTKELTVERLIQVLKNNQIKGVKASDAFVIRDPNTALAVLQQMHGDGINYGCDLVNLHCSGSALVAEISPEGIMAIFTEDNETIYELCFDAIVIYVPKINNNQSPLVFIFSKKIAPEGNDPSLEEGENYRLQNGLSIIEDGRDLWEKEDYRQSNEDWDSESPVLPPHVPIVRFLSAGAACFMNVQGLEYASADRILKATDIGGPDALCQAFKDMLSQSNPKG
ncbi:hypothetical protein HV782_019545 [Pseudomonas monsensis]|uniref:hypothetical protein n=1 Tax=Pseudomonas monsensis TaxID=2745509 RepID=UPI001644D0EB|nr:hypothetical protein [Pseudomonas monsensis]QXH98750.1 hypothetical protein HV782_019545 [Pseudomonas monsensis]